MATLTLPEQDYIRDEINRQMAELTKAIYALIDQLQDILDGQTPSPESPLTDILTRLESIERRLYSAGI